LLGPIWVLFSVAYIRLPAKSAVLAKPFFYFVFATGWSCWGPTAPLLDQATL
jgi:hypothetical protein